MDKREDENDEDVNEDIGMLVDEHIRIFDPNTGEDLVNQRGD